MKTFRLTSIVLLSLISLGAAHADEVPTSTVKYGDLDLSHGAGEATLYSRIHQAARKVCAPLDVSRSAPTRMAEAYESCLAKAVSGAVAKIDNREFAAFVAGKTSPVTLKLASR